MISLRPYQSSAVAEIREALAKYKRIIAQLPTGAGKGIILGAIADMCVKKGSKTLIVAHRLEIVEQDAKQYGKFGNEADIITPKQRRVPRNYVCVAMAQTLQRRKDKEEWAEFLRGIKMLIIDEAHTSEFNFLFDCISPDCYVCGFTATPVRYGNMRQLGLDYNAIVTGPSVKELITMGHLCPCKLFSLDAPKMDDVEWDYGRGDYALGQMAAKFQDRAHYIGAVENYKRICNGRKAIVFCCSSEQTIEITKAFNEAGIYANYVLSGVFDDDEYYSGERRVVLDAFRNNEFKVLVNLGIGTTGLDVPDIEAVLLMFSTTSVTKYLQCLGRASRPAPLKKDFYCLDFGSNYERLGRYEQDREWSVWHSTRAGGGVPPVKECPQCHKLIPVQMQDCPFCSYHFPTQTETYIAELHEIADNAEEESLESMVARKKLQGWKNDWILRDICQKNPNNPKEAFMKAIEILRTVHGDSISPQYWHFFSQHKLGKVKKEKDTTPKLF